MGYMRHHAIVVTSWDGNRVLQAHAAATEAGNTCTAIYRSGINAYDTFFVIPDGSKEGWTDSDAGDEAREKFIQWLHNTRTEDGGSYYDWAEVMYGDDEGELSIRGSR